MASAPAILNIHTPTSSFSVIHSLTQDTIQSLFDTLSRKAHTSYHGERVGPGWLKYEFNDSMWNLDDDSDYTIFVWRQQQQLNAASLSPSTSTQSIGTSTGSTATTSTTALPAAHNTTPTLHLRNPNTPLPQGSEYQNPSYYLFRPHLHHHRGSPVPSTRSKKSQRTKASARSKRTGGEDGGGDGNGTPSHKKDFDKFHAENGVRTVIGSIGPVQNVRMLLRAGYRHVYISRKFAIKHGFIPKDAAPGYYGYAGLVNIGTWPITLTPSFSSSSNNTNKDNTHPDDHAALTEPQRQQSQKQTPQPQATTISVFLAEEPHFDVVLGRSFFEKRQIRTSSTDPTDVVCLDTGEKIECELVILKDGRGEIVTVT